MAIIVVGTAVATVAGAIVVIAGAIVVVAIVVVAIVVDAIAAGATVVDATAASGVEELDDGATEITLGVGAIVEGEDTSALVELGPTTIVELAGREPAVGTAVVVEAIVATGTTTDVVAGVGCAVVVVAATPPTAAVAVGVLTISALTKAETVQKAIGATSRDSDESRQRRANDSRYCAIRNRRSATISAREPASIFHTNRSDTLTEGR